MNAWKLFFVIAALFAIGAGLPFLLFPAIDTLGLAYAHTPQTHLIVRMTGLLICVVGAGYAIVASNPPAHRGIVWMGVFGKPGIAGLLTYAFSIGVIPLAPFALGLVDVAFAIVFAVFLWKTRPASALTTPD